MPNSGANMSLFGGSPFEGPCTSCEHKADCDVYEGLATHLFGRGNFQKGDSTDEIDDIIIKSCSQWLKTPGAAIPSGRPATVRLSAFFDLAISLQYAMDLVRIEGTKCRFTQAAVSHDDFLIFPYTWVCPICIGKGKKPSDAYLPKAERKRDQQGSVRDFPDKELLAKPRARAIGDAGFKTLLAILKAVLDKSNIRICAGGGRRGEFDVTLASAESLIFGEAKAKPLVCFPLTVKGSSAYPSHEWITPVGGECSLYIAATDKHISLGSPDSRLWPLNHLLKISADPTLVKTTEEAWYRHLNAYHQWKNEPDLLRWVRFGCGNFHVKEKGERVEKRVANTKELPGLDRTDDIKKGATQLLLFSRLKFGCKRTALKSVLFGNTYAETHELDYLGPISTIRVLSADEKRTEYIFDAIIGLTQNLVNDASIVDSLAPLSQRGEIPVSTDETAAVQAFLAPDKTEADDG
jgi:hypothetical protein